MKFFCANKKKRITLARERQKDNKQLLLIFQWGMQKKGVQEILAYYSLLTIYKKQTFKLYLNKVVIGELVIESRIWRRERFYFRLQTHTG